MELYNGSLFGSIMSVIITVKVVAEPEPSPRAVRKWRALIERIELVHRLRGIWGFLGQLLQSRKYKSLDK